MKFKIEVELNDTLATPTGMCVLLKSIQHQLENWDRIGLHDLRKPVDVELFLAEMVDPSDNNRIVARVEVVDEELSQVRKVDKAATAANAFGELRDATQEESTVEH